MCRVDVCCYFIEVGKYRFLVLWIKKPKKSSKDFFCEAEMLADEHLIIRLETIYKAEAKFRLLKVRFSFLKNLLFGGDCVVNDTFSF